MDGIRLPRHELSFACLVESHSKACQCLFDFVVDAVKDTHPHDWQKTLCAGLGESLTHHINLSLQTNSPHTDIYSVCRLLRHRVDDIARYCGGELSNPHQKERLCLQVHGVETARHWVFHGDQKVSPGEVRSGIILLLSIVQTLSCTCERMARVADDLSELVETTRQLAGGKPEDARYVLTTDSIIGTLLYRSLFELKESFDKFCDGQTSQLQVALTSKNAFTAKVSVANDYASLFKNIRKAVNDEPKRKGVSKEVYIRMCKNVREARNTLVHNPPLKANTAKKVLIESSKLLEYFHLDNTQTASAMEIIVRLPPKEKDCHVYVLSAENKHCGQKFEERERILRPESYPLIGRHVEILEIQSALTGEQNSSRRKILICGPAGIGKSYLATYVANSLSLVHHKQSWLSCSTSYDLERELLSLFSNSKTSADLSKGGHGCAFLSDETMVETSRLYIFDDVCSSTMNLVPELIGKNSPAIITTRSPAVKHFLERNLEFLHVVELRPFSLADSWDLINEKFPVSTMSTRGLALIDKVLNGGLENLPLCVSIYSSWLAASKRKNKEKKNSEELEAANNCWNEAVKFGGDTLPKTWSELEKCFGNRLHVRGLSGVVQSAENYLEKSPLQVLLLAKICVLDSQTVPWHLMKKSYRWTAYNVKPRLKGLVDGVLGVMDWLFSDREEDTLVMCRDSLEELGLIRWEVSTRTVHVHRLTLQIIKQTLAARRLFLSNILSACIQQSREDMNITMELVYHCVSEELLLQVFSTGIVHLQKAYNGELNEEEIEEVKLCTFPILSQVQLLCKARRSMAVERLKRVQYLLVEALAFAASKLTILLCNKSTNHWASIYQEHQEIETNAALRKFLQFIECRSHLIELVGEERMDEALSVFEQRQLPFAERKFGCNSYCTAFFHSTIAFMKQNMCGSIARQDYLAKAAHKCPRLLTEPTPFHVWREIAELLRNGYEPKQCVKHRNSSASARVEAWQMLTVIKMKDNFADGHCTDKPTVLTALLLIVLRQQRQRVLVKQLTARQDKPNQVSKTLECLLSLLYESESEVSVWLSLGQHGRAVRTFHKVQAIFSHVQHLPPTNSMTSDIQKLIKEICEYTLYCFFKLGHFSLPSRLLSAISRDAHFKGFGGQYQPPPVDGNFPHDINECLLANSAILEQLLPRSWTLELSKFYDQLCTCYEHKGNSGALDELLSYLEDLSRTDTPFCVPDLYRELQLETILSLCKLVGDSSKLGQVESTLQVLSQKERASEKWKFEVQRFACFIKEIGLSEEPPLMNTMFSVGKIEAEFMEGLIPKAKRRALKCWRKMNELELLAELKRSARSSNRYPIGLEQVLVIDLAKLLQRIYSHQKMFNSSEWFAKFSFQFCKELRLGFLAGKYGLEYSEFLEKTGRHLEAVEQCRLVHRSLEEDFGDDYMEWLPDAPKALQMLQKFDRQSA